MGATGPVPEREGGPGPLARVLGQAAPRPVVFLTGTAGPAAAASVSGLARDRGLRVIRGRASRTAASPLRPFAEALLGLARDGWVPPDGLGPYRAVLGRLVPDWRDAGAPADSEPPPIIYGEAVLRALRAARGDGGILLVLEDLHVADAETVAVLEYLVDNVDGHGIAVVATLRAEPSPGWELAEYVRLRDQPDGAGEAVVAAAEDAVTAADPAAWAVSAGSVTATEASTGSATRARPSPVGPPPAPPAGLAPAHDRVRRSLPWAWTHTGLDGPPADARVSCGPAPDLRCPDPGAEAGPVSARLAAAVDALLRGRFADAEQDLAAVWTDLARLRLAGLGGHALAARALLCAFRGRDADLAAAVTAFDAWRGPRDDETPLVRGLATGISALLAGDVAAARAALALTAQAPPRHPLTGQYGLALLVEVVHGGADWPEYQAVAAHPAADLLWNRQFGLLARAVLAGRSGDLAAAEAAAEEALRVSADYPPARHLAVLLTAREAARAGWGDPPRRLREAETYYADNDIPAATRQCRDLLRDLGEPIRHRRRGCSQVPTRLWSLGVTVREYEVLREVAKHRTNREIAAALHLSPRTVERHVANLLMKMGAGNRRDLGVLVGVRDRVGEEDGGSQAADR